MTARTIQRRIENRARDLFNKDRASIAHIGLLDLVLAWWHQTTAAQQAPWLVRARRQLRREGAI